MKDISIKLLVREACLRTLLSSLVSKVIADFSGVSIVRHDLTLSFYVPSSKVRALHRFVLAWSRKLDLSHKFRLYFKEQNLMCLVLYENEF